MNATGTYTPIPPPESSPQTAALRLTGRVVFWHRHGQTGRQLLCHLDEWELTGLSTGAARGSFLPIGEACQLFLTRLSRRNDTSIALAVAPPIEGQTWRARSPSSHHPSIGSFAAAMAAATAVPGQWKPEQQAAHGVPRQARTAMGPVSCKITG